MLDILNSSQKEAATVSMTTLLTAGPGSGKTLVAAARATWLTGQGCPPHEILAVTFTNRAVKEFKERLEKFLNIEIAGQVRVNTFHSLALQIVESSLGKVEILSSEAHGALLAGLISSEIKKFLQLRQKVKQSPNQLLEQIGRSISYFKATGQRPAELNYHTSDEARRLLGKVYLAYQSYLDRKGLLDLDDLVPTATWLLAENPKLARLPGVGVRQVILDETQDTGTGQLSLLLGLLNASEAELKCKPVLLAAGDEKQQIFLSQTKDSPYHLLKGYLPEATTRHLTMQYRYGPTINKVAGKVAWRLGYDETVYPARTKDDPADCFSSLLGNKAKRGHLPIGIYKAGNEQDEAEFVAEQIRQIRNLHPNITIGVLVRKRSDATKIAKFLLGRGINCWVKGEDNGEAKPLIPTAVVISTVHSAKGAEFDAVFVLGLAQGIFPVSQKQLVTELRLFFVAITRARYLVYLSYPSEKLEGHKLVKLAPSAFLSLIESNL
jgi:DNA helicase II / ATP-dependent DNA helicase PcrA